MKVGVNKITGQIPLPASPEHQGPTPEAMPPQPRDLPRCPNCGWHDVRFSYTKRAIDVVLGIISVQRFKCRSCGHYFRRWYRSEV